MLRLVLLMTLMLAVCSGDKAEAAALGFQEWKSARIEEAKSTLDRTQLDNQIEKVPGSVDRVQLNDHLHSSPQKASSHSAPQELNHKASRADQRLQQAQLNFEISQELTITDYFALYVAQLTDHSSLLEAAKKLGPEEVAELMQAYQKQLAGTQQSGEAPPPSLLAPSGYRTSDSKGARSTP